MLRVIHSCKQFSSIRNRHQVEDLFAALKGNQGLEKLELGQACEPLSSSADSQLRSYLEQNKLKSLTLHLDDVTIAQSFRKSKNTDAEH